MDVKTMSLRLSSEQAEELEAVAQVDGVPIAESVRTAIAEHIAQRRADRAFQNRLQVSMERHRKILEKLAQ
jgi:predicted DNA-binding protein